MTTTLDRRAREDNLGAKKALEQQGVVTVSPDADTQRQWEELAERSSARLVDDLGLNRDLVAAVELEIAAVEARPATESTDNP